MAPISKHGTLQSADLVDVREVDLDQILNLDYQQSATHLFGKPGSPPPDSAVVLERRYVKVWSLQDDLGANFLALNKLNSAQKGRVQISNLSPGQYKLVTKVLKREETIISLATKPVGALWSNVNALAAGTKERKEQVLARGMPTEYVQVSIEVVAESQAYAQPQSLLSVDREELDQARDELERMFVVKDVESLAKVSLVLTSFSLVKRMRVACDLYRCDLPSSKELAKAGRDLVSRAFKPEPKKRRGNVVMAESTDVWLVLQDFYEENCPEKVVEIPQIVNFFLKRDGHLGVLFATLEDKYGVKFQPSGEWRT